ncbi:hypothetical protein B296_00045072 [Ensete ventricosum]|uniref:Uncharacterized protein n=1 Tax=Ensete ventricosum TaxID=4639 RepID=A0A426Z8R7_ENSVE|nr:hypothetical protein B296_00045072 [Ensete ventricosum]
MRWPTAQGGCRLTVEVMAGHDRRIEEGLASGGSSYGCCSRPKVMGNRRMRWRIGQLPTAGSAQAESCKLPGSGCTELGSIRPPWPPAQAAVLPPTRAAAAAGLGAKAGYFRSCRWWSSNLEKEKDDCD